MNKFGAILILGLFACSCATKQAESTATLTITVSGWVKNPGVYTLPRGATVMAALQAAGGFLDSFHSPKLTIVRGKEGRKKDIIVRLHNEKSGFELMDGDTVYARDLFL